MTGTALIVQGGGFRTAFSAGVLDAFLEHKHNPFSLYAGVSGGAISVSYFLAGQHGDCIKVIEFLAANKRYINMARLLSAEAIVDVEIFYDISNLFMPFDFDVAEKNLQGKQLAIVMTNRLTGDPYYHHPLKNTWQDAIIASCAFPFISKGKHSLQGIEYMDGAWSDPLPVEWVVKQGATDITIIHTQPVRERLQQSWLDKIGEIYYRNSPGLKKAFARNHEQYNRALDFIEHPPHGIRIRQIAPDRILKTGDYTNSKEVIREDYRYGIEKGNAFCCDFLSKSDI